MPAPLGHYRIDIPAHIYRRLVQLAESEKRTFKAQLTIVLDEALPPLLEPSAEEREQKFMENIGPVGPKPAPRPETQDEKYARLKDQLDAIRLAD